MHSSYLNAIKSFEGYAAQAQWDYRQHSVGFGTRARFAGEEISPEEAERRFAEEIGASRELVERHAGHWDEGTKAALTSLTFNAGSRWITSGLGDAIRRNDVEAVKEKFLQYTKAGGQELPGLVRRRFEELAWIGSPTGPAVTASAPSDHSVNTHTFNPAVAVATPPLASAEASSIDLAVDSTGQVAVQPGGPALTEREPPQMMTDWHRPDQTETSAHEHEQIRNSIATAHYWTALQQTIWALEFGRSIADAKTAEKGQSS